MMEFPLTADKAGCARIAYNLDITREETVEVTVPDTYPDIAEILCVHAAAFVRGKETDSGRGSISGVARAELVYAPEDGGRAAHLDAELPFSAPAVDSALTRDMRVTACVRAVSCSARAINPRKASISVTIRVQAAFYADWELCLYQGADGDGGDRVELLYESAETCLPVDVRERTFVISDELTLPQEYPPTDEVLFTDIALRVTDARAVGSKLVFKGAADILLFYISDGGGLTRAPLSAEFSQIVEFDALAPESEFDVSLMLTGAYAEIRPQDDSGRGVSVEIHAAAQCVELERRTVKYIADAFAPGLELECEYTEFDVSGRAQTHRAECVARASLNIPDAAGVVAVFPGVLMPEAELSDGQARVRCGVELTCLYADHDGRVHSARTRADAECAPVEAPDAQSVAATAVPSVETTAVVSGGVIELGVPVAFEISFLPAPRRRAISAISYDGDALTDAADLPSLTVTRIKPREKLWSLAKRYGSGVRLIMEANDIEREGDIEPGTLLLIPRRRVGAGSRGAR
jgi:LysM repeat protein